MPLNKLPIGQPLSSFPAGTWNTMVELMRQYQHDRTRFGASMTPETPPNSFAWRNDSGSDAPMGAVFRLTGGVDCTNTIVVSGNKPDGTLRPLYGISLGPVAAGKPGDAACFDPVRAYYYTSDGTPAIGESWGIEPSQWYLRKNRPGFFVVGDPHGSGTSARVQVIQTGCSEFIGKLAGSLSVGGSATVNVWAGAGGSEAVISGLTVTARDWLMKSGATAIASSKKVVCKNINGVWYVTEAECA